MVHSTLPWQADELISCSTSPYTSELPEALNVLQLRALYLALLASHSISGAQPYARRVECLSTVQAHQTINVLLKQNFEGFEGSYRNR